MQERLNAAAGRLAGDPSASAHLAGIIAAPEARELQVFWKGEVPATTQALLAELRHDLPVSVQAARFSRTELLAAHARVMREPHILEATPAIDGSGLSVVFDADRSDDTSRTAMTQRLQHLLADIPAHYSVASPAVPVGSRDAAATPAYAGSRIFLAGSNDYCTLGPPAYWDDDFTGETLYGWLTARHCAGDVGTRIYNTRAKKDERSSVIGTVHHHDASRDTSFIQGSRVPGRLFVGRPFTETASVPIGGTAANQVGNLVFTSGSATGLNGALRVIAVLPSYTQNIQVCAPPERVPDGFRPGPGVPCYRETQAITTYNVVRAEHIRQLSAVGDGDSGGVAFSFLPDGRALVRGVVIQKVSETKVACPSENRVPQDGINALFNFCTSQVHFTDWDALVNAGIVSGVVTGSWAN